MEGDNRGFQNRDREHNHNRNRHRFNRHGGGGDRGGHGGGGRGRPQRPLLTSSINGCGLALISVFVSRQIPDLADLSRLLAFAVVAFGLSAIVSYIAQRVRPLIIEIISDFFFLAGAVMVVYAGLRLAGVMA